MDVTEAHRAAAGRLLAQSSRQAGAGTRADPVQMVVAPEAALGYLTGVTRIEERRAARLAVTEGPLTFSGQRGASHVGLVAGGGAASFAPAAFRELMWAGLALVDEIERA
jgi:hypothetical protein